MPDVTIVDYGLGNLFSVERAIEHCGGRPIISGSPDAIENANTLILPGVGAFSDGMKQLQDLGLDRAIINYAATGKHLLGICLGMQLLATESEEFGLHKGLDLIPGVVRRLPDSTTEGMPIRIPHVGWETITSPDTPQARIEWQQGLFADIPIETSVYFTHSYCIQPANHQHTIACCRFGEHEITIAVRNGNVTGVQFHPERSANWGLHIIRNFISGALAR